MLWFLLACSGYDGRWNEYPDTPPVGLENRFRDAARYEPTPEQAFEVRSRCPRIIRARARPEGGIAYTVEIEGERLDTIRRISALLPNNKLAEVHFEPPAPNLIIPAACASCEIVFGVDVDGHPIACTGPSRSILFENGEPKAPTVIAP